MSEAPSPEWAELTALEHSRINPYQTWCHDICFGAGVRERFVGTHKERAGVRIRVLDNPYFGLGDTDTFQLKSFSSWSSYASSFASVELV